MQSEVLSKNVIRFSTQVKSQHCIPLFLCSDIHLDSIHCKRDLFKKHLKEIQDAGGHAFIFGDLFDIMGSFGDRRLQREDVDPLFLQRGQSYLDAVVTYAVEFLRPYATNIAFISRGNHETAIQKFHNTDVIMMVVSALNVLPNVNISVGGYKGYIYFTFSRTKGRFSGMSIKLHYHHGFGGGAPRSKGILAVDTETAKYPDAKILVRGHTHQKWHYGSKMRERASVHGNVTPENIHYIQLGSYKDAVTNESDGWEIEKNFEPTKMGGWFLNFNPIITCGDMAIGINVVEAE